jgi:hypothetical protein
LLSSLTAVAVMPHRFFYREIDVERLSHQRQVGATTFAAALRNTTP